MSATISQPSAGIIDVSSTEAVPFSRLVKVEWRKMLDTRSGKWLLAATLGLLIVVAVIALIVTSSSDDSMLTYQDWMLEVLLIPLSILLPVFPILCITSEWSQRTGLSTFTLEANRTRLVLAKLVAVMTLAVATMLFTAVLGVFANMLGASAGGYSAVWSIDGRDLAFTVAVQILYFLMAFGLGALLLSSSAAISVFYVVALLIPFMVFFGLVTNFEWASNIIPFVDIQTSSSQVSSGEMLYRADGGMTGAAAGSIGGLQYAQFAVATLIWVVLPLVLGFLRIKKAEIK